MGIPDPEVVPPRGVPSGQKIVPSPPTTVPRPRRDRRRRRRRRRQPRGGNSILAIKASGGWLSLSSVLPRNPIRQMDATGFRNPIRHLG